MLINFFGFVPLVKEFLVSSSPHENTFIDYSKKFQKVEDMRASYQGSEILNELSIKIAQFLDYFCKNCCFETLPISKKRVTTVTLTYQSPCLVHPFLMVHTHKNSIHPGLNHSPF